MRKKRLGIWSMQFTSSYLTKKEYPKDCTATKKRQIRKKAEKFRIDGGELIYISNNGKVASYNFGYSRPI